MDVASFVLALLATAISVFTYFKHDRKLKKQEGALNELVLEEKLKERELSKKADLNIRYLKDVNRHYFSFIITNQGRDEARNIRVDFDPSVNRIIRGEQPSRLSPGQSFRINHMPVIGSPKLADVKLTWTDSFAEENERTFQLQIS